MTPKKFPHEAKDGRLGVRKMRLMNEPGPTFEEATAEYGDAVFRFFMSRRPDRALAEDLTQETFLKAWRNWPPANVETTRSWLFTIAANLFRDHLRHKAVVQKHEDGIRHEATRREVQEQQEPVEVLQIRELLEQIDPEGREVLMLREMDGMTIDEISEHTGLSRDRVRYRLKKAREKFVHLYNRMG